GYRKHFGVDSLCAIRELRLLSVAIDPAYERAVLAASSAGNKKRKREEKFLISEETFYGFAFIAGYTAGGAPYGITIEEAKSLTNADLSYSDATPATSDDDIPFEDEHESCGTEEDNRWLPNRATQKVVGRDVQSHAEVCERGPWHRRHDLQSRF